MNLDNLAGTLEEFSEFKFKDAEEEARKIKDDFAALRNQYDNQLELIIESAVKKNSKKFRLIFIPLFCTTNWCTIISTITALLSIFLSFFTQNGNYLFVLVIPTFLVFFEKIFTSNFATKMLVKTILPKTEKALGNRIKKSLTSAEIPYSTEIIKKVFENCSIIKKAHGIIK